MTPLSSRELQRFWLASGRPDEGHLFCWGGQPVREYKKALRSAGEAAPTG
jgi:hypothetical protein